jgi:hypothetical protein
MSLTLTLTFKNYDELLAFVKTKTSSVEATPALPPLPPGPPVERFARQHPDNPANAPVVATEPVKKRGRPSKLKASDAIPSTPTIDPAPEVAALEEEEEKSHIAVKDFAPKEYTFDEAKAVLAELNTEKGMPVAKKALAHFNATRLSELDSSVYAEFIEYCEKLFEA